ncbi:MAG: hypothetical protein IPF54_15365 [Draconibacterium sp.]|nr:hypothetical protein [Draconibacterium sp.]
MIYNPLEIEITKNIKVNLYYTGLSETAIITGENGKSGNYKLDREFNVIIPVTIPARSQTYYVIK